MTDIYSIILANGIALFALLFSAYSLRENIISRKTSVKPILLPGRISEFKNDDNLFACNFEYPMTDDLLGNPKLVYFGIKNIGKGPANNVRVISFTSEEEEPHIFRVGSNVVRIPEDGSIPFVIRLSRKDDTEYNFVTYSTTICFENIFGNTFFLSVRLWIRDEMVAVIEYNDEMKPKWREFFTVVWREMEANGFFETRNIESSMKENKNKAES